MSLHVGLHVGLKRRIKRRVTVKKRQIVVKRWLHVSTSVPPYREPTYNQRTTYRLDGAKANHTSLRTDVYNLYVDQRRKKGRMKQTDKGMLKLSAEHFEFLARMLEGSRTVRPVKDGKPQKAIATWKAAVEEARIAADKIREHLG